MANITAADVNKLRQMTGSGMMDCKKALVEAEGNFDKAIEILRKKGQKVAAKRGDNEAKEGLVVAKTNAEGNEGIILALNCETDFVAKNEEFRTFVDAIVDKALTGKFTSIDALLASSFEGSLTVADRITEQVGKTGEKMEISNMKFIAAPAVVAYNHPGNQVASLVGLTNNAAGVAEAGRDVAMQIAAMNPISVSESDVPTDVKEKELEIGRELARKEGKPEAMIDKIAEGKLKKFYQENTLLNQAFIKENKKTVLQYLQSVDKELTVSEFSRIALS